MPYVRNRIPAVVAIAYVMRVDKCDRAAAIRQIEAAALDGALRWVRRGSNHWGWDAEVFRTDLQKLWPKRPAEGFLLGSIEDTAAAPQSNIRGNVQLAAHWHEQPMPDMAQLQRLTEAVAELRETVIAAVRTRDAGEVPADVLQEKLRQESAEIDGEVLASLARGQLAALLETQHGLERLPYGSYWVRSDGAATAQGIRVLAEGTVSSNRHSGLDGTAMVHSDGFRVFAAQYLAKKNFAKPRVRAQISNAPPPIKPLQGNRAAVVPTSVADRGRDPNWQKWKHVPETKLYQAVALSLNIAPEKLRPSLHAWMGGKRFDEDEEFAERLFVVERNLQNLRPSNSLGVVYYDEEPVIRLQDFVAWALSIGWSLPCELVKLATDASGAASPVNAREAEAIPSGEPPANAEPTLKGANQRHGGRKKGSGAIDDTPRLRAMLDPLAASRAPSVHDAACKVSEKMVGTTQSRDADISRLRTKFAKAHGTKPPAGKTWSDVAAELNEN